MNPWCLIPARGGSKRFPRKNIATLKGKPLLVYSIESALGSGLFTQVWVSTDDPEIGAVARQHGAQVHNRPAHLATDESTIVQVCLDFSEWLRSKEESAGVLCVLLPTAVLLRPDDLRIGFELLTRGKADFVMAVTEYLETPFIALHEVDGYLRPYFGRECLRKTQELPHVWVDSGSFYFARLDALKQEKTFYGTRVVGYKLPRDRAIDIDEPVHLRIAEALWDFNAARAPKESEE